MQRNATLPSVEFPRVGGPTVWFIAVLFFGLGDIVTTSIGLEVSGVTEANPLAAALFEHSVLGAMIVQKGAVIGGGYLLWRHTPHPHRLGVPLGLAILGVTVTAWNLHVLVVALIP